jgi:hypothetical protein
VSLAGADGAIGCWNDKYYWNFWRPIDAVRQAATDGNPATTADPSWRPLFDPETATTPALTTPNFPDHPSGHSCVSSAILNTMQEFFGTDKIGFDIVDARVWGGIHFRTADAQGAVIGRKVAHWERKHFFQPVG